jgi:hypothetical protein
MLVNKAKGKIGDCETCDRTNLQITLEAHNMWMCEFCVAEETAAITRAGEVNVLLEESKKIDYSIQIKPDVFNAKTTPAIELQASIQQDENIKEEDKLYTFAKAMQERADILRKAIFDDRAALLEKENEYRMWQSQIQSAAGMIRDKRREEFKASDISYQPQAPSKPKSQTPKAPSASSFKRNELKDACAKYGVDPVAVRVIMLQKNMTAENAAKFFAEVTKK